MRSANQATKPIIYIQSQPVLIYIRSISVSIFTFVLATIVYIIYTANALLRKYLLPPQMHVPVNVIGLLNRPLYWPIAFVAFAIGLYWMLRRVGQ
jgi:hypothetical protein